jgi:predicted nucleotidyltransferase
VAALIARANEINARDELVFYVKRITAFGSYLTEIKDLGDIDLVVEVAARREKNTDESKYRARNSGKTVDFMASLGYGEREVLQLLKARKSRLSFASQSTVEQLNTETRVIFEWRPDAARRAEMEAFDWRLHEPLRQVKEWLVSNPGINVDPVEIARWCLDVAAILKTMNWQHRLFRDWSDNAAHDLLSYWGVTPSEAAAEKARRMMWDQYLESVSFYFHHYYENSVVDALIEEEIYEQFAHGTDDMDAAILTAKRSRWKLIEDRNRSGGWISRLLQRINEMEGNGSMQTCKG